MVEDKKQMGNGVDLMFFDVVIFTLSEKNKKFFPILLQNSKKGITFAPQFSN